MITRALVVVLLLSGCATAHEFKGPNGRPTYTMRCGTHPEACYKKAGELCSNGYKIIDRGSGTVVVPVSGSLMAAPQHHLAIECN